MTTIQSMLQIESMSAYLDFRNLVLSINFFFCFSNQIVNKIFPEKWWLKPHPFSWWWCVLLVVKALIEIKYKKKEKKV